MMTRIYESWVKFYQIFGSLSPISILKLENHFRAQFQTIVLINKLLKPRQKCYISVVSKTVSCEMSKMCSLICGCACAVMLQRDRFDSWSPRSVWGSHANDSRVQVPECYSMTLIWVSNFKNLEKKST